MPEPRRVNQYTLIEELGRGGSGVVFRARDTNLGRTVALKLLIAGRFAGKAERARFLQQARFAAAIEHPLIVKQYDAAVKDNIPYIATELIEGIKLEGSAERFGWNYKQVANVIAAIADAIAAAHRAGIIHRDLKPANIIVDGDDRPHITDFGLAKAIETTGTITHSGQIMGTPAYMSSEQATGDSARVDFRTDIYSIGAILYELLTGVPPFQGTHDQVLFQAIHDDPQPPTKLDPRIPRDLETICLRAMSKDASRRFQSAEDLREELFRFIRGEPILSRPISRLERAIRFCRRYPTQTASASGIILLLATSTLAVTLWGIDSRNRAEKEARLRKVSQDLLRERTEELVRLNLERAQDSSELGQVGKSLAWIDNAERIDDQNLIPQIHYDRRWSLTSAAHLTLSSCTPIDSFRRLFTYDDVNQRVIVTTSDAINIYNTLTGNLFRQIKTSNHVRLIATNRAGTLLAVVQNDPQTQLHLLQIWDVATSNSIHETKLEESPSAIAFAPNNDDILLKTATQGCSLFALKDQSIQQLFPNKAVFFLNSERRNSVLATIDGQNTLSIYAGNLTSPIAQYTFNKPILIIRPEQIDGYVTAQLGDSIHKDFFCWQYDRKGSEPFLWTSNDFRSCEIDPAHERILLWGPHRINVYCLFDPEPLHQFNHTDSEIRSVSWASDNAVYFSTGPTSSHLALNRWNLDDNHVSEKYLTLATGIRGMATSKDRYFLLTYGNDAVLRVWTPPQQDCTQPPFSITRPLDGQMVVPEPSPFKSDQAESTAISLIESQLNRESNSEGMMRLNHRGNPLQDSRKRILAFTSEDRRFQVIEQSSSKMLFDIPLEPTFRNKIFIDEKETMLSKQVSKKEVVVVPIDPIGSIISLSVPDRMLVQQIIFHPTRPLLAAHAIDGSVRIWRIKDKASPLVSFKHRSPISIFQWTESGESLVIIGQDGKVTVYQLHENSPYISSQFNIDKVVTASAIDPTGSMLAATTNRGDVQIWDLNRGEPCSSSFPFIHPISSLRFTSDSSSLLLRDTFGLLHYLPIPQPNIPRELRDDYIALILGEKIQPDGRWEDIPAESLTTIALKWQHADRPARTSNAPSQINWHKRQAVEAIVADNPRLAVYHFREATRLDPKNIVLQINLAHACALARDWEGSFESWAKATELGDRQFSTYYNTFLVAAKLNRTQTLERIQKILESDFFQSDDPNILLKLSQLYISISPPIGNLDHSIHLAEKVTKVWTTDIRAQLVLGGALYLRGDKEEAARILTAAIEETPFAIVGLANADGSLVPRIVREQVKYLRQSAEHEPMNIEQAYTRWISEIEADLIEARSLEFRANRSTVPAR